MYSPNRSFRTQKFFSNRASKHKKIPKYLFEKIWTLLSKYTNARGALSILDAGCGAGAWSRRFKEKNCDVIGLDFSEGMLKQAKSFDYRYSCCKGDLLHFPLCDETFDLVFLGYVLHHFTKHETRKILLEAHRLVKENGILVSIDPNLVNLYNFLKIHPLSPLRDNINHLPHERPLTFKNLEEYYKIFHRTYFHTVSFIPSIRVDASENFSRTFFVRLDEKLETLPLTRIFGSNIILIGKKTVF